MGKKLFLHGVPDTPALWEPVLGALNLPDEDMLAPALPGFGVPVPAGFDCTKAAYGDWAIEQAEAAFTAAGPVDLVGHDWGALIAVRIASLRPDLFNTWTIANAAPHVDYKWHRTARLWQTPIIGELVQWSIRPAQLGKGLAEQGLPETLAQHEAQAMDATMKRAILKLYRSAKSASEEWDADIDQMPPRGLVFWGDDDPYVPTWVGEALAKRTGARFALQTSVGHWSVVERAEELARELKTLWQA